MGVTENQFLTRPLNTRFEKPKSETLTILHNPKDLGGGLNSKVSILTKALRSWERNSILKFSIKFVAGVCPVIVGGCGNRSLHIKTFQVFVGGSSRLLSKSPGVTTYTDDLTSYLCQNS